MKYYRVQTGFGPDDFVSVDENELEACIRAQITGRVAVTKEGTISGNIIQKITPDWTRALGFKRGYKLVGEDYDYVSGKVSDEYRKTLQDATERAQEAIAGVPRKPTLPGSGTDTSELAAKMKQI